MAIKDQIQLLESIFKILGIAVAGFWVLWKYVLFKESSPRIEFSVDVDFVGVQGDFWLVEFVGNLENRGQVPYKITNLDFETNYLTGDDLVEESYEFQGQVNIRNTLKRGSWLPSDPVKPAIIHPGIKMKYNYIYKVTTTSTFVLIHGKLDYGNGLQTRADKLLKVPTASAS